MRKKSKLVCGVGINDEELQIYVFGRNIKSYDCWRDMIKRCYDEKVQTKQPTYIGCTVTPEWLYFSTFKKWYDANYIAGFHLDKDILVEGNKIYSPDTCRFVPTNINALLTDRRNYRGFLPLGITESKPNTRTRKRNTTYVAQCNNGYGEKITKTFKTLEEAVAWYSITKTRIVCEVATKALEAGKIGQDIFDALVSRTF